MMNRLLVALTSAVFGLGCGGSDAVGANNAGGSADDAASVTGGSSGVGGSSTGGSGTSDSSTPSEAGIDLDAFPIPDGPIGVCAACIRDMCQTDLATCATDPKCQMGVICAIQNCSQFAMGDAGAAGLVCITNCFGDLQTAFAAVSGLTCVTTKCDSCTSLLDGGGAAPIDSGNTPPIDSGSTAPVDGGGD